MNVYTPYDEILKNDLSPLHVHVVCGRGRSAVDADSIAGYCFFPPHKGYVTNGVLKEHECLKKHCPFLYKFFDYPIWLRMEREEKAKAAHRAERSRGKKMKAISKNINEEIRLFVQVIAEEKEDNIIVTSVKQTSKNAYTVNYVSDNSYNDWHRFFYIAKEIKREVNIYIYFKHIKTLSGRYATIDDLVAAHRQYRS